MARSLSSEWILKFHDEWTRATLNYFFQECQTEEISNEQFMRWLVDRVIIAKRMVAFSERVTDILGQGQLPCLKYVKDDYNWLMERLADFHVNTSLSMSYACQTLVESIDKAISPENNVTISLTALWTFLFAAEQGWRLGASSENRKMKGRFAMYQHHLARDDAVLALIETQSLLDMHLRQDSPGGQKRAQDTFETTLKKLNALMDEAILARKMPGMKDVCSKCGRQGHTQVRCTFKNHI